MTKELPQLGLDERQLILNCSRLELDNALYQRTGEILCRPIAWDSLIFYAKFHSVAPLLYRNLRLFNNLDLVPHGAKRVLLQLSHRTEYQNRLLSKILKDLLKSFSEAEIPVVVLKGIALVELIYGHLNLRPLIDLNLLVPKHKLKEAIRVLLNKGYSVHPSDPSQGTLFSQIHLERRKDFEVHILLQWHIVNWPRVHNINLYRVWKESQPVRLSGRDTLILSPEDLVLYLCFQPDKHGFLNFPAFNTVNPVSLVFTEWTNNRLIRFVDIYEVIRHYQNVLNWNLIVERARESGIQESVYTSLDWVTKMIGKVVEPWVLEVLHSPSPRRIRNWVYEALNQQREGDVSITPAKVLFSTWWLKKQKLTQLHIIQLLNLLEFMFLRNKELSLLYGSRAKRACLAVYLLHMVKIFFLGLLPWTYYVLIKGKLLKNYSQNESA